MEERRLPGETEAVWNLVRDGEVWTYRVWASPYLPEEVRAFPGCRQVVRMEREVRHKGDGGGAADGELRPHQLGAGGGGGEAAWGASPLPVGGREPVLLGAGRSPPRGCLPGAGGGGTGLGGPPGLSGSPCFTAKGSGRRRRPWRPSPSTPSPPCASWGSMRYSGQVWAGRRATPPAQPAPPDGRRPTGCESDSYRLHPLSAKV